MLIFGLIHTHNEIYHYKSLLDHTNYITETAQKSFCLQRMGKKPLSWTLTLAVKVKKLKVKIACGLPGRGKLYQWKEEQKIVTDLLSFFCKIDSYLIKEFQGLCM